MESILIIAGIFIVATLFVVIPLVLWYAHQQRKKLTEQHQRDLQSLDVQLKDKVIPPEMYERLRTQLNEKYHTQLKKLR